MKLFIPFYMIYFFLGYFDSALNVKLLHSRGLGWDLGPAKKKLFNMHLIDCKVKKLDVGPLNKVI